MSTSTNDLCPVTDAVAAAKSRVLSNGGVNDIEMYAGDDYVYGEEDDEQDHQGP